MLIKFYKNGIFINLFQKINITFMEGKCCSLSIIKSQFTTIFGDRREYSRRTFKFEERHFTREPETPKGRFEGELSSKRNRDFS